MAACLVQIAAIYRIIPPHDNVNFRFIKFKEKLLKALCYARPLESIWKSGRFFCIWHFIILIWNFVSFIYFSATFVAMTSFSCLVRLKHHLYIINLHICVLLLVFGILHILRFPMENLATFYSLSLLKESIYVDHLILSYTDGMVNIITWVTPKRALT